MTDIYEVVTNKIINALENGSVPWRKPWKGGDSLYANLKSKKPYSGINIWLLSLSACSQGFESPYWLTFNQAKALGGTVKSGQKGTAIVFWNVNEKKVTKDNGEDEINKYAYIKTYSVFNVDQCKGLEKHIPVIDTAKKVVPIKAAEAILSKYIKRAKSLDWSETASGKACYTPSLDKVTVPLRAQFDSIEGFYSTAFHEAGHSTGHKDRLNRKGVISAVNFGSETYSQEELIAEFCAGFLCAKSGIENQIQQNAAYIKSWIKVLKNDKKLAIIAASQGQKAAEYILGK